MPFETVCCCGAKVAKDVCSADAARWLLWVKQVPAPRKDKCGVIPPFYASQAQESATRDVDICSLSDSNLLDCSCNNTVALALGSSVHIWNAATCTVMGYLEAVAEEESISSLCWSKDGRTLGVGTRRGQIQVRSLGPHGGGLWWWWW